MSNYSVAEVNDAIEALDELIDSGDSDLDEYFWGYISDWEKAYDLTIGGKEVPVEVVESGRDLFDTETAYVIIRVGSQTFRKTGYYSSHGYDELDGDLEEVLKVAKTIEVWETK